MHPLAIFVLLVLVPGVAFLLGYHTGWDQATQHPKMDQPSDDGVARRPRDGRCPSCGVPHEAWCKPDCPLVDPIDYR